MDIFKIFAAKRQREKAMLDKRIQAENATFPSVLMRVQIPFQMQSKAARKFSPKEIWRSRGFVVEIYDIDQDWEFMRVHRAAFTAHYTRFMDGITHDRIMQLKAECGRAHLELIEIYPKADEAIDLLNVRHLWVKKNGSVSDHFNVGQQAVPSDVEEAAA